MLSPEELVRQARARCKYDRQPGVGGFCRECLLAELGILRHAGHFGREVWCRERWGSSANSAPESSDTQIACCERVNGGSLGLDLRKVATRQRRRFLLIDLATRCVSNSGGSALAAYPAKP